MSNTNIQFQVLEKKGREEKLGGGVGGGGGGGGGLRTHPVHPPPPVTGLINEQRPLKLKKTRGKY